MYKTHYWDLRIELSKWFFKTWDDIDDVPLTGEKINIIINTISDHEVSFDDNLINFKISKVADVEDELKICLQYDKTGTFFYKIHIEFDEIRQI